MKARITFDLDLTELGASNLDETRTLVQANLIDAARARHKALLHNARRDPDMDGETKAREMAGHMQAMMMTFMAETNMKVEELPDDAVISTDLPFEREPVG